MLQRDEGGVQSSERTEADAAPLPSSNPSAAPPQRQPFDPLATAANASLPLLVQMPDGQRHQVDVAPNASVRDLKSTIAEMSPSLLGNLNDPSSSNWDLDFAGSILNDDHSLGHYNIPDAYDHATGLLKTISDNGYLAPEKKVEALDKAVAVVHSVSRGERDMERLISAVFDSANEAVPDSPTAQPSLRSIRRSRRSKIPLLNFANLNPIEPTTTSNGASSGKPPNAPPTPSQLIRRLSRTRPDLYDPTVVENAITSPVVPYFTAQPPQPSTTAPPRPSPASTAIAKTEPLDVVLASDPPAASPRVNQGRNDLKRGNTWFTDVISSFGNAVLKEPTAKDDASDADEDVEGDSEGEDTSAAPSAHTPQMSDASASTKQADTNQSAVASTAAQTAMAGSSSTRAAGTTSTARPSTTELSAVVPEKNPAPGATAQRHQVGRQTKHVAESALHTQPTNPSNEAATAPVPVHIAAANAGPSVGTTSALQVGTTLETHVPPLSTSPAPSETTSAPAGNVIPRSPPQGSAGNDHDVGSDHEDLISIQNEVTKQPKKRGRKRKNPHLSEEQRKAQRQAQNRESAKLSRIRRKNMTIEYEKRVNTLEGENENLRDTVAALTDRLEMLQNLLTISVQKRPMPGTALVAGLAAASQPATATQMAAVSQALNIPRAMPPSAAPQQPQAMHPVGVHVPFAAANAVAANLPPPFSVQPQNAPGSAGMPLPAAVPSASRLPNAGAQLRNLDYKSNF